MIDLDLVAAARAEVQSREAHYPAQIASGKKSADEATIDYQAWTCIAGFLATGRFESIPSAGADGATFVSWPHADHAAAQAVASTSAALDVARAANDGGKVQRLGERLARLTLIARRVSRQHALIDSINHELRNRREQREGIAA